VFFNEGSRHLIKGVEVGNSVYVHPDSDMSGGGWAIVMSISLRDRDGKPDVVEVVYANGRRGPADEFMISKVIK